MADRKELTAWPTKAEEMTVDLMLRILGNDTQVTWLKKQQDITATSMKPTPLYFAQTNAVIAGVGLMAAIRALRDADPVKAEAFVRDYWLMCDAGDSFGETLWEFTEAAGLDPSLITLESA